MLLGFQQVCLVYAENGHYDLVLTRSHVQDLALCQSVVYEVLYRGVFGLTTELDEAVTFIRQQKKASTDINGKIFALTSESLHRFCDKDSSLCLGVCERPTPPLPYRIAKALDPVLFRNVELDIVQEEKREIKLRLQGRGLYGVFCPGDKCQVQLDEDSTAPLYHGHIQELNEPKGPVIVYIEELGEKRTVSYTCLRPLPLSASTQGSDSHNIPIAELGPLPFGDRRGRRRKSTMPGAAEFQAPAPTGRSPRSSVPARRGLDGCQNALTAVSAQPVTVDCVGVADSMEAAAGAGYCMVNTSMPMASQPHMGALASSPGAGQGAGGGVVYWMPVVTVPYASNMGQVNLAWSPSQDPYGKDLPLNDMNTLRYFFNLGVEYFRISANMQQQQQQSQQQSYLASSPLPQLIPSGPPASSVMMALDQGASFVTPDPPKHKGHAYTTPTGAKPTPTSHTTHNGRGGGSSGGQEAVSRSETMEMSSDLSDSGCTSCGEGGQGGEEEVDAQMELASNRTDEDSGSTQGEGEGGSEKGGTRVKGKRKYYMYGPHKLIKPIKDIPPRFQMMLAENSAAKARCEGQPIYMQLSAADLMAIEQGMDPNTGLNADAQCFYPTHQYDAVMVDDSGLTTYSTATHPPPIMMHPPPVMQVAGGQTQLTVVNTSLTSCSSSASALPPPAVYPLSAAAAAASSVATVRSGDGKLVSLAANLSTGKGPAHSGHDKRPEEFARPSSGKGADVANSPRVSVSSLSINGPPHSYPASTSMLPPPPPGPLHAGHAPTSAPGGGKQCFYVYPSHSTGYPTMPATPPQGQGLSQGQVVYVMNPHQGYGPAPPCTAYQPSLMGPPTHTMGMPCPPVAVQ
ncbi:uncharacterized protein [Littorina saxatilis]|uniref:uncharacterized protein n=1 Tax=Littorina saxatilis TaxID=31220 RepID=UPI0038B64E0E